MDGCNICLFKLVRISEQNLPLAAYYAASTRCACGRCQQRTRMLHKARQQKAHFLVRHCRRPRFTIRAMKPHPASLDTHGINISAQA